MKIFQITFFLLIFTISVYAQSPDLSTIADSIEKEGKALYHSEMASWYGADVYLAKFKGRESQLGGYISYDTGKGVNNVLLTKGDDPIVMATITFDYDFNLQNCLIDTVSRKLRKDERQLFAMRKAALLQVSTDTAFFRHYRNTNYNLIPIIYLNKKRVYMIMGTGVNGVVLIGNDYLVELDERNNVISKRKFHNTLLNFKTGADQVGGVHSHLPQNGQFMSATDICTLMLYKKFSGWTQHTVVCKEYVSIFNMKTDQLVILTQEAWKRITDDQAQRNKKQ